MHTASELPITLREGLRYCAGVPGSLPPITSVLTSLERLGLIEISDPGAWAPRDRYSPTHDRGAMMLRSIGVGG